MQHAAGSYLRLAGPCRDAVTGSEDRRVLITVYYHFNLIGIEAHLRPDNAFDALNSLLKSLFKLQLNARWYNIYWTPENDGPKVKTV